MRRRFTVCKLTRRVSVNARLKATQEEQTRLFTARVTTAWTVLKTAMTFAKTADNAIRYNTRQDAVLRALRRKSA